MKKLFIILFTGSVLTACNSEQSTKQQQPTSTSVKPAPDFNPDSAYHFVEKQVSFGPRVPNTKAHEACADYLISTLKTYTTTVFVQTGQVEAFDGTRLSIKNIIAGFNPEKQQRIMLCAHWDTRPFADQDTENQDKPIDGANDGGSGVGVLLEVARQLSRNLPEVGVDIILFDAEDYGQPDDSPFPQKQHTYCLGSQYWTKNPPVPNYKPLYGILLDMVGGPNAVFTMEGVSMAFAPNVVQKVWDTGNALGYSSYFSYTKTGQIIDDHYYINQLASIPVIDIIEYDESTGSKFNKHWHTHEDNMQHIDRNTLKAVGQTLLEVLFKEQASPPL